MSDADVIVVGGRPGRPRRHRRAGRRRPARDPARPGARGLPRRTGVLVLWRVVLREQPRAAPGRRQRLARARPAGLAGQRRLRPPRGRLAPPVGRGVRRVRRRREAPVALRPGRALLPDRRAGPSAAATSPPATATRCRASTSRGAPGPGVIEPFERRVRDGVARGKVDAEVPPPGDRLITNGGASTASPATSSSRARRSAAQPSSRTRRRRVRAAARRRSSSTSGGIGANHDLVRANWPERLGTPPARMLSGVPDHVDGRMIQIAQDAGGSVINPDRMWHYTEGIENWSPIWTAARDPHPPRAVAALAGRVRPPAARPAVPGLRHAGHARAPDEDRPRPLLVRAHPEDHRARVRALGLRAEPRSDRPRRPPGAREPAARARRRRSRRSSATAPTSSSSDDLGTLVRRMNALTGEDLLDAGELERTIKARDREIDNPYTKDPRSPRSAGRAATSLTGSSASPAPPPARSGSRAADRGPPVDPHPQDAGRARDGPVRPRAPVRRRAAARPVRRRRGRGLRRWRRPRLPLARGHVPGRLSVQRSDGRARGGAGSGLNLTASRR